MPRGCDPLGYHQTGQCPGNEVIRCQQQRGAPGQTTDAEFCRIAENSEQQSDDGEKEYAPGMACENPDRSHRGHPGRNRHGDDCRRQLNDKLLRGGFMPHTAVANVKDRLIKRKNSHRREWWIAHVSAWFDDVLFQDLVDLAFIGDPLHFNLASESKKYVGHRCQQNQHDAAQQAGNDFSLDSIVQDNSSLSFQTSLHPLSHSKLNSPAASSGGSIGAFFW